MNTAKPISTISFNSEPFLRAKLDELTKAHVISVWAYIFHEPEPDESKDESGKKAHAHVYIEPSKRLNTDVLRAEFNEPDLSRPDKKPRGVLAFRSSKFADWFLYGLHDKIYLARIEQSRVHQYTDADFVASDEGDWRYLVSTVDRSQLTTYGKMFAAMERGVSFEEYVLRAAVPLPQFNCAKSAWEAFQFRGLARNGRPGHANIDPETGEIIEPPNPVPDTSNAKNEGEWKEVRSDDEF